MNVVKQRFFWFTFSGILVLTSLFFLFIWGLKPGIDFTGGSIMRIEFTEKKLTNEEINTALEQSLSQEKNNKNEDLKKKTEETYGKIIFQTVGDKDLILKFKPITESTHKIAFDFIKAKTKEINGSTDPKDNKEYVKEIKFDSIGPFIGNELKRNAVYAIFIVLSLILIWVAWSFRTVSNEFNKYESFRYGIATIVALIHDILIILGIFSLLGHFYGIEVDTFFIAALLTTLGYSVNDTIVTLDRIRENVLKSGHTNFDSTVNKSIKEIMVRSINISLTNLIVLTVMFFFGGDSIHYFILALIFGVIFGTYSSIFLASLLLAQWKRWTKS